MKTHLTKSVLAFLLLIVAAIPWVYAGAYIQETEATVGELTSATALAAPSGAPATRTTIGLGERVAISIDPATWSDTDCNETTGEIENDTMGDRIWAASGAGAITPSGVTQKNNVTMTADFDPGAVGVGVAIRDSQSKFTDAVLSRSKAFTVIAPVGETTAHAGWNTTHGGVALFEAVLAPTSVSFDNIRVTEQDGAGSTDGCWFVGSAFVKMDLLTGGTWGVNNDNLWKYDNVGWIDEAITYYRNNPAGAVRAPCTGTLGQEMHVKEGSSGQYDGGILVLEIGVVTVTSTRDGVSAFKVYP